MAETETRYCEDCDFYRTGGLFPDSDRCAAAVDPDRDNQNAPSLVRRVQPFPMMPCSEARKDGGPCGPEGAWWERKPVESEAA